MIKISLDVREISDTSPNIEAGTHYTVECEDNPRAKFHAMLNLTQQIMSFESDRLVNDQYWDWTLNGREDGNL